jgi:hypothetical protein
MLFILQFILQYNSTYKLIVAVCVKTEVLNPLYGISKVVKRAGFKGENIQDFRRNKSKSVSAYIAMFYNLKLYKLKKERLLPLGSESSVLPPVV